jgi:plasmid rolling circle replication initiator protein Rep
LDRYEIQTELVETLKLAKNHRIRRKAASCADCHRTFRHWRCRNSHDWAEAENSCSVRVCPHCSHRRAKVLGARMERFLLGRERTSLRYAVLAERNSENLVEGMQLLWESWTRLRRSVRWKRKVKGCIVALEVTYNREEDTWHPHLNVLMEGEYFPFEELRQAWSEASEHRGQTAFIRAADAGTVSELIKYVTKVSDLIGNPVALEKLLLAVHKKRFVRTYGSFYGLSVADEAAPMQAHCPDCESTELVALGRVKPQQVSIDFNGILRVRGRDPDDVCNEQAEAESFRPGLFLRHKYAPRPGHDRTPAWAVRLDQAVKVYADEQRTSLRQLAA